jgi:hypothetical protein
LEVRQTCVAAQVLEELLDLRPGIHIQRLSIRLSRLEAHVYRRDGGALSVLHEGRLVLRQPLGIKSTIDLRVAMDGSDVGGVVSEGCRLLGALIL